VLVPAITGAGSKPLASLVMAGTSLRFFLTAAYQLSGGAAWKDAAAAEGLLLAAAAVYAALAFELEDSRLHTVLPTLRRGPGRRAISGTAADELAAVHREAGVRKQL
jgi:succinate-acetate transporter protein